MGRIIKQIPPAKALINGIRSIGYSFSTSVADIIDNSISANSTRIDIFSDPLVEKPYFIILDNGIGMNEKELINAMKFGSDRRNRMDGQLDLGRFGLGLKSASLSQCRELVVVSKCKDEINAMSYDLDIIEKTDDWNMIVLEEIEIKELPRINELLKYENGTLILWRNFDKILDSSKKFDDSFRNLVSESKKHVELVFHRFYDIIEIYFNYDRIEKRDPFLEKSHPKTQIGREIEIEMNNSDIVVRPYTLPHANQLTFEEKKLLGSPKSIYDEQGLYIYRNERLIVWGTWLHMSIRSEFGKSARVRVDIPSSLDLEWSLDVKKSTAKIPDKIKERIRASIDDSIIMSKRVNKKYGIKELSAKNKIWDRLSFRDGKVSYSINPQNPLLVSLREKIGEEENKILDMFISQIEDYLPQYSIYNDSADEKIEIVNKDVDTKEEKIELLKRIMIIVSESERADALKSLLESEKFYELKNSYDELYKEVCNE